MKENNKEKHRSGDSSSAKNVKHQNIGKKEGQPSSEGLHGEVPGHESADPGNRSANQALGNRQGGGDYDKRHDRLTQDEDSDRQEMFRPGDESTNTGAPDDEKDHKKK